MKVWKVAAALIAAMVPAGVATAPAHAGLLAQSAGKCPTLSSKQVFRPWLDIAQYVPAPGGTAESTTGWKLEGGAKLVAGNEPWKVAGSGTRSLALPAGAKATTSAACVGLGHPTMRFFAKRTSGTVLSTLKVEVLFDGLGGLVKSLPIGVVLGGSNWQPTLPFPVVANLLPLLPGQMTPVAFRFTAVGGTWQVDDVYVDPWRAR
ncbi:MAG: hypothetical protein ABW060_08150 [Solirubrobacteraceae bacterium]|jgi:hypothetical protein